MKIRILSAAVLLPLLLVTVLSLPKIFTALLLSLASAVAAYELLYRTELVQHRRLVLYSMVMAFLVPLWCYCQRPFAWALMGLLAFCGALFGEMMASHVKLRFDKVSYCLVAGLLIPFFLSGLVRIHGLRDGRVFIMIPFIMAFLSDTGAYFAGRAFGKHKLAPVVSPNKTIEGVVGGVAGAVIGMVIYGLVLGGFFGYKVNYLVAVLYGIVGSLAAVFGDLCFSVIKRQTGIKDYGTLIPGHGGILDRFDSMTIVAPLAEALLLLIPMAVK